MTNLLERFLRRACLVGAALCLLVLGACGPGGGGTGTGPTAYFSYASATPAAPGPADACLPVCGRVDLELDGERITVNTGCGRFIASGAWNPEAGGDVELAGRFEPAGGGAAVDAVLRLQSPAPLATSTTVRLTLLDASGAVKLGPLDLVKQPEPSAHAPGACTP